MEKIIKSITNKFSKVFPGVVFNISQVSEKKTILILWKDGPSATEIYRAVLRPLGFTGTDRQYPIVFNRVFSQVHAKNILSEAKEIHGHDGMLIRSTVLGEDSWQIFGDAYPYAMEAPITQANDPA